MERGAFQESLSKDKTNNNQYKTLDENAFDVIVKFLYRILVEKNMNTNDYISDISNNED